MLINPESKGLLLILLWIITYDTFFSIWQVNNIVKALENAGKKFNLDIQEPADKPLPPSSFQMFLKKNRSIPGIVLTDHKEEYSNKWETAFHLWAFPP